LKKKKTEKKKEEKKPEPKSDSLFTKKSEAGKGDAPRIGISQDEWEKKWESIFGKKEESVRPRKSNNGSSKS
jgi:hypothetical protein|tara:strand:- start:597 stop:812 length:216 start_codon:yes stop_codon:yes gene_type:complete